MAIDFCRDCVNFEDRRDVDDTVLCGKNIGPFVCCEEFEPRDKDINGDRLYHKFCAECINFEEVNGIPICARNHIPGIACQESKSRFEKLKATRYVNHAKTALAIQAANEHSDPEPIPDSLIEIGRKVNW